uniref:Chaperone DnaJ-domain superfamily protein n=1 Tax=Pelargonium nanum TaxID=59882 RepID=A0A0F7H0E1_9ROSI
MGVSTTGAAAAPALSPPNTKTKINVCARYIFSSTSFSFATKPPPPTRFISIIRNSSDATAPAPATTTTSDSDIEVPEGPPSLISALNVERALRGIPITDIDYYGELGIPKSCRSEQLITAAYKSKVDEVLKQQMDEDEVNKKLEILNESYRVLSTAEERRLYDWSLSRSQNPDTYSWPFEVDDTVTAKGDPPPQEPEDFGPTRVLGYSFLAWLLLSIVMSIALNVS